MITVLGIQPDPQKAHLIARPNHVVILNPSPDTTLYILSSIIFIKPPYAATQPIKKNGRSRG